MHNSSWSGWLRSSRWETRLGIIAALAVGLLLGTLISHGVRASRDAAPLTGAEPLTVPAAPSPAELSASFRDVARKVEPAVVNISTEAVVTSQRQSPHGQVPEPFQDFFQRFFDFGQPEQFTQRSLGSGMIVDPDGYILTNYHVVQGADKVRVRLEGDDSKEYPAKVVGFDQETDLAVVKIDVDRKLPFLRLGNSDAAQVGDWVLAVGSPFGLEATVTAGIISYKGRQGEEQFQRFIQTDAAINRGNSGGPLVNLAGEVIGINTAIVSNAGVYAGVGFALPSNTAIDVYNQIVKHGRVVRGSIGIRFDATDSQNQAILRSFGVDHGVVIGQVVPGGPADKAGLRRGDVITAVGDTPVRKGDDLVNKVAATTPGEKLALHYIRDKKPGDTSVTVEERAKVFPEVAGGESESQPGEEGTTHLGLRLEEMNAATAQNLGLGSDDVGLLVRSVEPGSITDEIGLQEGDVILEFNQKRVHSLNEFLSVQRQLKPGDDVVFWLKRRTQQGWIGFYQGGTLPEK